MAAVESTVAKADKPLTAKMPAGVKPAATRPQPTFRSEFADTALWSATLETNKDGIAEAELDMPQNLTAWKIRTGAWATAPKSAKRRLKP